MKKLLILLAALLLMSTAALAEDYVTLAQLREQASDGWHKTYQAYGREVVAKADPSWMTESDTCPIIEVEGVGFEEGDERFDMYLALPDSYIYAFPYSVGVDVLCRDNKYLYGLTDYMGKWRSEEHIYLNGETPDVLPENVDLSYEEFLARIDSDLSRLTGFHLSDFHIREVTTTSCSYKTKKVNGEATNGDPLTKTGSWYLNGQQLFYGIPVVESSVAPDIPGGLLQYAYSVPDYFYFQFKCMREKHIIKDDVPLLSYDAFIGKLEELIDAGKLRGVDEIAFGYLPYVNGNTHVLLPTWRILGGYHENPNYEKKLMPYVDEDGATLYPIGYREYYFNAQTGDMIDIPKNERNDAILPNAYKVLSWDDVQ